MTGEANNNDLKEIMKDGVRFNIKVTSPSETITSLQIVCFFNFPKNQHYEGGTYAVNEHFGGEIHQLRKSGIFRGAALETLLITPQLRQIPAHQLLLLGLGDPEEFNLDFVELVGYTTVIEAVKLNVKDFCFAPSLKDAGLVMSFEKTDISKMLAKGILRAINTSAILSQKNLLGPIALTEINLLAGQEQAKNAYLGLQQAFGL
jgi:hypothetical protein